MRRLAALVLACLLTPLFTLPVVADVNVATLNTNVNLQVGASHVWPNGAYGPSAGCETGYSGTTEFRCSFEFDISSIISSAKITEATLTIRRTSGCATNDCPIDLASFTGNGSADLGDVTACCDIATTTPGNNFQRNFNVLGQIVALRDAGKSWAGFHIARSGDSTRNPDVQDWSLSTSDLKLTVGYIPLPVDISVVKDGNGTGAVVSNSPGIDCGSTCTGTFTYSQPLTLSAATLGKSTFTSWSGIDCNEGSQSLTCTFIVPSTPGPITATFTGLATPTPHPPSPHPSATSATPPSSRPSSGATQAPRSGVPATQARAGPSGSLVPTDLTVATLAPGETPTLAPLQTDSPSDAASGDTGGPQIILILLFIVVAVGVGVGAYFWSKRRLGIAPPGA